MKTLPIAGCSSREEAVKRFLGLLEEQGERIRATERKLESIYRFRTPEAPFFSYDVEDGYRYRPSAWVSCRSEHKLDMGMQSVAYGLEALPRTDVVPILSASAGGIEFLPRLFGGEYETTSSGACLQKFNLVHDLSRDVNRLPDVDPLERESVREVLEDTAALLEYTDGGVRVAYPYMQGCLNNACRFMDQEDMLAACVQEKAALGKLMVKVYEARASILRAVREKVGNDELLRVRGQGHHPPWVRGLIIDDFISVVRPEDYYDVCVEEWRRAAEDGDAIYLHTCGPISQCLELFARLPGLAASEFVYAEGQSKTTAQVERLKQGLYGKVVLYSIGLPRGGVVDDPENLTAAWIWNVSSGGGILMNGTGPLEHGRRLCEELEL